MALKDPLLTSVVVFDTGDTGKGRHHGHFFFLLAPMLHCICIGTYLFSIADLWGRASFARCACRLPHREERGGAADVYSVTHIPI